MSGLSQTMSKVTIWVDSLRLWCAADVHII